MLSLITIVRMRVSKKAPVSLQYYYTKSFRRVLSGALLHAKNLIEFSWQIHSRSYNARANTACRWRGQWYSVAHRKNLGVRTAVFPLASNGALTLYVHYWVPNQYHESFKTNSYVKFSKESIAIWIFQIKCAPFGENRYCLFKMLITF